MIFQRSEHNLPLPRDKEVAKDKRKYTKLRTRNSSPMGPRKERLARLRQLKAKQRRMAQALRHQRFPPLLKPMQLAVGQALIWNNYLTADYKLINNTKIWRMRSLAALSQWPSSLYNRWCQWGCQVACLSLWIKDAVQEWCQYRCNQDRWGNLWWRKLRWTWAVVRWALTTARFQCICARSISLSLSWCPHETSLSARNALLNNF